jgi:hypothetical protein
MCMHELESEFAVCECTIFSVEDVMKALHNVAIGKACGLDGLPAEALKFCGRSSVRLLSNLFSLCCKHAFVPSSFCIGRITPVPKRLECAVILMILGLLPLLISLVRFLSTVFWIS